MHKTLQGRKGYKPPELYAPNKEAYDMLKAAVVGGPSLVFTCKHVANQTRIRSHQYEDAKPAKRILGYDANSLYPSTMMKEMPCGEGVVTTYTNPEAAARVFPDTLRSGEWFGFVEVDIEVPEELWPEFEEFPPLFINRSVPDNAVPQHMHDYLLHSGRKRFPDQKKLLGVLSAKKIHLYAPLLQWYLNNGLKITAVYRTIDYKPRKIFEWFVKEVADNRRKGRQGQGPTRRGLQTPGQQRLRQVHRSGGAAEQNLVHTGRGRGRLASSLGLVQRSRRDR